MQINFCLPLSLADHCSWQSVCISNRSSSKYSDIFLNIKYSLELVSWLINWKTMEKCPNCIIKCENGLTLCLFSENHWNSKFIVHLSSRWKYHQTTNNSDYCVVAIMMDVSIMRRNHQYYHDCYDCSLSMLSWTCIRLQ